MKHTFFLITAIIILVASCKKDDDIKPSITHEATHLNELCLSKYYVHNSDTVFLSEQCFKPDTAYFIHDTTIVILYYTDTLYGCSLFMSENSDNVISFARESARLVNYMNVTGYGVAGMQARHGQINITENIGSAYSGNFRGYGKVFEGNFLEQDTTFHVVGTFTDVEVFSTRP